MMADNTAADDSTDATDGCRSCGAPVTVVDGGDLDGALTCPNCGLIAAATES